MIKKRFFQDGNEILTWIRDKETWEKLKTDTDVINKLNELNEQNEVCREAYKELKQEVIKLNKENKELQERNNRQAKQLDKLYKLMEKQDYKALQNIIQDFKEAEELLKQEWKCFDD